MSKEARYPCRPGRWCLFVKILFKGQIFDSKYIYVFAKGGGSAKAKAWPKLQSFVIKSVGGSDVSRDGKGVEVEALLRNRSNGKGADPNSPVYILRERCTYYVGVITTKKASAAFVPFRRGN